MSEFRLPPGPPPANNPITQMRLGMQFMDNPINAFARMGAQYGDIFMLQFGKTYNYVLSHPDHIHEVLVKQAASFHKDPDLKNTQQGLARFLGNGLLTSDGEFWRRQRKLAAPALHAKRIAHYADTMVDSTARMLKTWRDGSRLDISDEMTGLTMQIVAKTLFNTDISGDIEQVGEAMVEVQGVAGPLSILPTWIPTPRELRRRRAKRLLDEIVYRFIHEWRVKGEDKGDLLSMLLLAEDEDGKHMTDEQARDEAITLFLAGHETTANALNWTWYLLAQHPDIEAKLHAELDAVLAGKTPTLTDLENLPYVEMIVKEAMRLYPPAWITGRQAIEDVEIAGYHMPKGSVVNLVFYMAHHDARWWPQPEQFMPERFSPENEAQVNKRAYTPFGGGPRVCIGNAFAMMEARLLLATIAQHYRLALQPGQTVAMNPMITLNPKDGLTMTLHKRELKRERVEQPVLELA